MRGFVFTVIFSALFFILLIEAGMYVSSRESSQLSQANFSSADHSGQAMDDLSTDLMDYLGLQAESNPVNSTNKTNITFDDTIPSTLAFPATEFSQWIAFVYNTYSTVSNTNITMNYSDFQANPRLIAQPYNLTYGYPSLDKPQLCINGSGLVSNYSVLMSLNRDINLTDDANWSWSVGATSLFVSLNITDNAGEQLLVKGKTSGYIDPSLNNSVVFYGTPSGTLTIEAGNLPGYGTPALLIIPSGLSAHAITTVLLNGTSEVTVFAPIMAQANEQRSNLIIFEG